MPTRNVVIPAHLAKKMLECLVQSGRDRCHRPPDPRGRPRSGADRRSRGNRGFEYHSGLTFTLFARGVRGELGRGGRYRAGADAASEGSTGFTLYTDTVLRAVPPIPAGDRVYLPAGTAPAAGAALRRAGHTTVAALAEGDPLAEATRLACTHVYRDGTVDPV